MTEFDLKNWLHTTSVVWELSLPGLNFWLGNTLAYIILHLQKFAASTVQTASYLQGGERARERGNLDGWMWWWLGLCKGGARVGLHSGSSQQEGSLLAPVLLCSAPCSSRKGHIWGISSSLPEAVE